MLSAKLQMHIVDFQNRDLAPRSRSASPLESASLSTNIHFAQLPPLFPEVFAGLATIENSGVSLFRVS